VISTIKTLLTEHHHKVRSRNFLEAVMGASALLALADGKLSLAELVARDFVLHHVKELQVFEAEEASEIFYLAIEDLKATPEINKQKILKAVAKFSANKDLAVLLVRVCIVIARWDDDFSEPEQKIISELCHVLGLDLTMIYSQLITERFVA
jgi:tellurite resistance protein TerB